MTAPGSDFETVPVGTMKRLRDLEAQLAAPAPDSPTRRKDPAMNEYINLLGKKVKDRVSGLTGVVTSVCYDISGCIQGWVNPGVGADGKLLDGGWIDTKRLVVTDKTPVMDMPAFGPLGSEAGPEAKAAPPSGPAR